MLNWSISMSGICEEADEQMVRDEAAKLVKKLNKGIQAAQVYMTRQSSTDLLAPPETAAE